MTARPFGVKFSEAKETGMAEKTEKTKKAKAPASAVEMLTDTTFKQQIGSDKDVLVAFTAPWCGRMSHKTPHCKLS